MNHIYFRHKWAGFSYFFFFYLTCPFALLFYFIYLFVNSIYYYHQNLAATNNYLNFNFVLLKAP